MQTKLPRPLGVSILSGLAVVIGCFILLSWLALVAQGKVAPSVPANSYVIFFAPLQAILSIICGCGLWQLKEWARVLTILRSILVLCYQLFTTLTMPFPTDAKVQIAAVQIVGSLLICIYFVLPTVKETFSN